MTDQDRKANRPAQLAFLLVSCVLYVVLWSVGPQRFIASDPLSYSRLAFQLAEGDFFDQPANDVFCHRLGVLVPVSLLYRVFGVHLITTNLWPLCAALIVLVVVWCAARSTAAKASAVLLAFATIPLFEASISLYPDIIATAFMALSTLALACRSRVIGSWFIQILLPTVAVASLFLAFLAKLSAYWVLPLWLLAFVADYRERNFDLLRRFYVPVAVIGIGLGLSYLVMCEFLWGDPLARFRVIQELTGKHTWSWGDASGLELANRLTLSAGRFFFTAFGPVTVFALFGLLVVPKELRIWAGYTCLTVLFFWFGTTSFASYEPLKLSPRMALPALPGFCILGGHFISRLRVFAAPGGDNKGKRLAWMFAATLVALPFVQFVGNWRRLHDGEGQVMNAIATQVRHHPQSRLLLLCSDRRSPESLAFYFGYKYPKNVTAKHVADLDSATLRAAGKAILFVHERRSKFLRDKYGDQHWDDAIAALDLPLLSCHSNVTMHAGQIADMGKVTAYTAHPSDLVALLTQPIQPDE